MRRNQIIYMGILIETIILASFHGGRVSYLLLYMSIATPVITLAYTFYVYKRLQFYQHTPDKIVEKEKMLPYEIVFRNEDRLPFTYVKVKFYEEQCYVENEQQFREYYLLPGDEKKLHTTLKCFYRGCYHVGVKSIEIMDFLYLFKINYPVMWPLELTVLPKVVPLKTLGILPTYEDPKHNDRTFWSESMTLGNETRAYQPGDHLKQIHWKASARKRELLTRKIDSEVKRENVILMDLSPLEEKLHSQLAREDKVLEVVLAISYYMQNTNVRFKVAYEVDQQEEMAIRSMEDFGKLYHLTGSLCFNTDRGMEILLEDYQVQHPMPGFYILALSRMSALLCETIQKAIVHGHEVIILYIDEMDMETNFKGILESLGVRFYWIRPKDRLDEVIG